MPVDPTNPIVCPWRTLTPLLIPDAYEFRCEYGALRLKPELAKLGFIVSKNRIRRIMKRNGLIAKASKKYKVTTMQSTKPYRVADNLLKQNFKVKSKEPFIKNDYGQYLIQRAKEI